MSLVEAMRGITQNELEKLHLVELGIVTSIYPHSAANDKNNYECNVRMRDSDIELRHVPVATQFVGLVGIPKVGDLVLLSFINGDVNAPVIIGRLYNDEDRPPLSKAEEVVYVPPYDTNAKARRIYMEFPSGLTLTMTDDEVDLNAAGTKVVVHRDGDVIIESKTNINVKAQGDAILKSTGAFTISGDTVKIESGKELNVKCGTDMKMESGSSTEIKSSSTLNMESTAQMKIKGATVNIN